MAVADFISGAVGVKNHLVPGIQQTNPELQPGLPSADDSDALHEWGSFLFHELGDSRCGHFWSHGRVAAVNGEIGACDEGSMAGAQERNRLRHFLRLADASQQMERSADSVGLLLVAVGHFIHQTAPSPARRNRIDANLVRSQIHGFIARELQYRRFGHGIEPAPRLRHLGADAAEVDHGAATALHHVWFHRLQHHDAAHDINVVAVQPIFARRIEGVVHVNARQVNQEIDATELCHSLIHAGGDLGIVCQVGFYELHILTECAGNCLSIFVIDIGDHYLCALTMKSVHYGGTDHGRASGHDGNFPFESFHACLPVKKLVLAEESYHAKERVTRAVRFALQVAFSRDEAATCLENLTHHLYLGTWHKAFGAGETVPGSKLDAQNCDRRRRSVWAAVGIGTATEPLRSHGCFQPDTGADLKRPGHFQPVHVSRFFAE